MKTQTIPARLRRHPNWFKVDNLIHAICKRAGINLSEISNK